MSIIRDGPGEFGGLSFDEPEVARYVTVDATLGGLTIPGPGGTSDRHFQQIHAPGLLNGSIPVILFRTIHSGEPRFSVRLNATRLIVHTFAAGSPHSWHIFIPPGKLLTRDNELTLNVDGDGDVTFSDVLILYKSKELTVRKSIVVVAQA